MQNEYSLAQWGSEIVTAIQEMSAVNLVSLLSPLIRVKGKDKLGSAGSIPNDFNQLKQKVTQISKIGGKDNLEGFTALMQFMVAFLVHS